MTKTIGVATALALVFGSASAAFACEGFWCGGFGGGNGGNSQTYTTVTNVAVSNNASVSNSVEVKADTGDNTANGGSASAGSKANGGTGGTIHTGNAAAASLIANEVNTTDVEVIAPENCGCEDNNSYSGGDRRKGKNRGGDKKEVYTELNVALDNNASVSNDVEVKADTGDNEANGGSAEASSGNNGGYENYFSKWSRGGHGKKNGGSEANGGHGGLITTGDAESSSGIVNLINSVILRVL